MKWHLFVLIISVIVSSGCATVRHAVPMDMSFDRVTVNGMQDIRAISGTPCDFMMKDFVNLLSKDESPNPFFYQSDKIYSILAISGGGGNGAYGAGILNGWSKSQTRPEFKIVTGISTGAIIAPFAFLGKDYDNKLKEFYTQYSTKDLMLKKFLLRAIFSDSLASDTPLAKMINKNFDAELLHKIAIEYLKGRRLYIGTTNLDTQKLVIWDMGKIACQQDEAALKLFRKIILASASIPIVFPPVYFEVKIGDKLYDEMHVDGGITTQVFFLYDVLQGLDRAAHAKGFDPHMIRYKLYIIRNGYVERVWKKAPDRLSSITERAIDAMINAQGVGNLFQLYAFIKNGKGEFNLAYIPSEHIPSNKEFFDRQEMQSLFDLGFIQAVNGYPWEKTPPGFKEN